MASPPTHGTTDLTCPEARSHVRAVLKPLSDTLPEAQAALLQQDACLVTSELVTNAMLHGGGVRDFDAGLQGHVLTIRVGDRSTTPPTPRSPAPAVPGGHGWLVIQRLSTGVTVEPDAHGKTVRVTIDASRMSA
ncbi:ATP-binding protein [Streptomyces sp. NPDC001904]|uniref:ATP-binding protein n=1 Tax=Streptomyces sp. NPDC001904 TaxID=3154531 RepID=UPI003324F347